jgi:hypothetical protein
MKLFSALTLLWFGLIPVLSSAQDIAFIKHIEVAETTAVRTEWSKDQDLIDGSISKAKLVKMKQVTSALVDYLKDSAMAAAYRPVWHGEYFSVRNSPGAQLKFGMTCHFIEQNADLSITANDMQPLLDQIVVNGKHFVTARIPSSVSNGTLYFADGGADASGEQMKMWLVTSGKGQLPWVAVTRKEYLIEAKAELTAIVNSIVSGWRMKAPVRSAEAQEAEKKAVIDQLKTMYSGADLEIRSRVYLRCYKSDEEFQKDNIDRETAGFRATIRMIDSLMAHLGAVPLSKPAVVSVNAADFRGFEDGQTNYMLVRMNGAYFNSALSEEKPQLFLVTWRYDGSNAGTAELDSKMVERVEGEALGVMLKK